MSCKICPFFLQDFLLTGVPEELALSKLLRKKAIGRISVKFAEWIHTIFHKISTEDFLKASTIASRISKRGRKELQYEYILSTATFNLLHYEVPWLKQEETYIVMYLLESSLFKGRNYYSLLNTAKEYIGYTTIRAFYYLREIHDDHVNPKGLMTNLNTTVPHKRKQVEKEVTLYDRDDDYQKDILEEVDLSDLYT